MNPEDLGVLLTAIIAVTGAFGLYFSERNASRQHRKEVVDAVDALGNRITALEVKTDVFWTGLMKDAATILHHPHAEHARRDELLEKLLAHELDDEEMLELRGRLVYAIGGAETVGDPGEQLAASILLRLLDAEVGTLE